MHDPLHFQTVIKRDAALPGFATLLGTQSAANLFDIPADRLTVDYIRYKPGTNCLVRYALSDTGQPFAYGKTFAPGSQVKAVRAHDKTPDGTPAPRQLRADTVIYPFPADARLRSLSKLERSPSWLESRLELPAGTVERQVLAYKPERRCVLALQTDHSPYVLKLFTARAFDKALCATKRHTDLPFATPALLRSWQRHNAMLFQFIAGPTLREEIQAGRGADACRMAGELLARLHGTAIKPLPVRNMSAPDHGLLCWLLPDAAGAIASIVKQANVIIQATPASRVTLHGDFYDKQVILGGNGAPVLIDLDDMSRGDHRIDLATFIAHLQVIAPDTEPTLCQALLDAYSTASGNSIDGLQAYVALATLQLAHHGFRTGAADWQTRINTSIHRAQSWLDNQGAL